MKALPRIFWIPPASLLVVEIYARRFDGWGAWATAPLFLLPFVLSLAIVGPAMVRCFSDLRSKTLRSRTVVFTITAALPVLWLLVRRRIM